MGQALAGRGAFFGPFAADLVANGGGRSCKVILRNSPGLSKRKSVKGGFETGSMALATELADGAVLMIKLSGSRGWMQGVRILQASCVWRSIMKTFILTMQNENREQDRDKKRAYPNQPAFNFPPRQ